MDLETWLRSIAIAIPVFAAIEAWRPRHRMAVPWRGIALAAALFAVNRLVVGAVTDAPYATHVGRVVAAWLLTELAAYGVHVAMHRVSWLWRFHRMHHAPGPIAFHRSWWIHPVDVALFGAATTLACHVAGAPVLAAVWVLALRRGWAILLHANVAWPATPLDHVIVTPSLHERHHREDLPPANFAANLALLDRLFGTWAR